MHSLVGNLIPSLSVLLTMALGGLTAVIGGPGPVARAAVDSNTSALALDATTGHTTLPLR